MTGGELNLAFHFTLPMLFASTMAVHSFWMFLAFLFDTYLYICVLITYMPVDVVLINICSLTYSFTGVDDGFPNVSSCQ